MMTFALNHMTVAPLCLRQMADLARALDMCGVELRNDLESPIFDGRAPSAVLTDDLAIFALAEVKAFNAFDGDTFGSAIALMNMAVASGALGIALIPQVGGQVPDDGLRMAIATLGPELKARGLLGLIEPIGFEVSTLRTKADVVAAIDASDFADQFGLIHDTFHHFLAGEGAVFPNHTKLVHISGVTADVAPKDMLDAHRGLIDQDDRLGNVTQINELLRGGYDGPFSFEAFSPDVHADIDRKASLSRSIRFIETEVMALAA
jgi:2-keto-myo-inositol isomerase